MVLTVPLFTEESNDGPEDMHDISSGDGYN